MHLLPKEEEEISNVSDHDLSCRRRKVEKAVTGIFSVLAILLFTTLVYYSLGVTGREMNAATRDEHIILKTEMIWKQIVLCVIAFVVLLPAGRFFSKQKQCRKLILAIACLVSVGFGIFWVVTTATIPDGDQAVLMAIATRCNRGDFSDFDRLGYMTQCPHQLGMMTMLRIVQAIFGEGNYQVFQYLNICFVPLIICSGYFIVGYLCRQAGARWWYLCLAVCCFPMYGYLPFVYGEIISTALISLAAWMLLSCLEHFRWTKAVLCGVSTGLAIVLRQNALIAAVAFVIVMLAKMIAKISRERIILLVCLLAGCLLIPEGLKLFYRDQKPGYPAQPNILYIVMGLNDDEGYPGWSNRYNFRMFTEFDGNEGLMTAKAKEDLDMYIQLYKNDKSYRNDFFVRKMNSQWQVPLYHCIAMNCLIIPEVKEPGRIARWIYYGSGKNIVENFMKQYQMLLYICILFLLVKKGWKNIPIEHYALLIGVFGYFLFSLMWEAKARYVFPSLLMMLPYFASGMQMIMERIWTAIGKKGIGTRLSRLVRNSSSSQNL